MTNVLTIDQYREFVDHRLDELEQYAEDMDEELVMLVGNVEGSADVRAPSQKYDSKRISAQIGYDSAVFEDPSGCAPLDEVMQRSGFRWLFGSVTIPRAAVSEDAEGIIDEQQAEIEEMRAEREGDDA